MILLLRLTFIYNLFLQFFDGLLTYQVLSLGVPEANPLVNAAISEWGVVWGLLYCGNKIKVRVTRIPLRFLANQSIDIPFRP